MRQPSRAMRKHSAAAGAKHDPATCQGCAALALLLAVETAVATARERVPWETACAILGAALWRALDDEPDTLTRETMRDWVIERLIHGKDDKPAAN